MDEMHARRRGSSLFSLSSRSLSLLALLSCRGGWPLRRRGRCSHEEREERELRPRPRRSRREFSSKEEQKEKRERERRKRELGKKLQPLLLPPQKSKERKKEEEKTLRTFSLSPRIRISRSALPLHPARRALRAPICRLSRKREQALNARKRLRSLCQFFFFEKLHRPSISFLFLLPPSTSSSYDLLHLHALFPKRWPTSPRSRGHRQRPTAARSPRSSSSTPTAAAPSAAVAGRPGRASTSASLSASTAPVSCFSISFSLLFSLSLSFLSLWPFGSFSHASSLPIHIDKNEKTK